MQKLPSQYHFTLIQSKSSIKKSLYVSWDTANDRTSKVNLEVLTFNLKGKISITPRLKDLFSRIAIC